MIPQKPWTLIILDCFADFRDDPVPVLLTVLPFDQIAMDEVNPLTHFHGSDYGLVDWLILWPFDLIMNGSVIFAANI